MQNKLAQELGLGTFELSQPGAAGIGGYWSREFQPALEQILDDQGERLPAYEVARFDATDAFLEDVAQTTLISGDAGDIGPHPAHVTTGNLTLLSVMEKFNTRLGSFNSIPEGNLPFMQAAYLVGRASMGTNQDAFRQEPLVENYQPNGDALQLHGLYSKLSINLELPRTLFKGSLGAELIHKAAWKSEDPTEQAILFETAENIYGRIIRAAGSSDNPERLQAMSRLVDISFHRASQEIRKAWLNNDAMSLSHAKIAMRHAMVRGTDNIMALNRVYYRYNSKGHNKNSLSANKNQIAAKMFTDYGAMMIRAKILDKVQKDEGMPAQFEVRTPFMHEGYEPGDDYPVPTFALVVGQHDANGIVATRTAQLVHNVGRPKPSRIARGYLGSVVIDGSVTPSSMVAKASFFAEKYGPKSRVSGKGDFPDERRFSDR